MPVNKKFRTLVEEAPQSSAPIRGRGASWSPANRFEKLHIDLTDADVTDLNAEASPRPATQYFCDGTKSVITRNNSPDVGFETSLNPYRGCEHGCIYCYARPTHEYLGFSAGLDFESKIMVKTNAPELLRAELESPRWQPQTLVLSGVTDPYQPVRAKIADHARLPRSAGQVSKPSGNHHKKPSCHARYRSFAGAGGVQCSCGQHFGDVARPEPPASARTAHHIAPRPARRDRATSRGERSSWGNGCTDNSRPHRS